MIESIIRVIKISGNAINIVGKNLGFPIHDLLFSIKKIPYKKEITVIRIMVRTLLIIYFFTSFLF